MSRDLRPPATRTFMPASGEDKKPKKASKKSKKRKIATPESLNRVPRIVWVIIVALLVMCVFLYSQYRTAERKIQQTKESSQSAQVNDVVKRVGKIMIIPSNEVPTIATVTNMEKLKGQPFFVDAKNGDKVLVFNKQKKAILYRPSTNQIVNVNIVTATQGATPAGQPGN